MARCSNVEVLGLSVADDSRFGGLLTGFGERHVQDGGGRLPLQPVEHEVPYDDFIESSGIGLLVEGRAVGADVWLVQLHTELRKREWWCREQCGYSNSKEEVEGRSETP